MKNMKKRLTEAIKDCNELCRDCDTKTCACCFLFNEYEKEADALIERGVLMPPVKIGATVYAVVDLDNTGPSIEEYTVGGMEYTKGKWYVCEECDPYEFFEVGSELALLSKREAKKKLEEMIREMREEKDTSATAAAVPLPQGEG